MKHLRKTKKKRHGSFFSLLIHMLFPPHCVFCNEVTYPGCPVCATCAREVQRVHKFSRLNESADGKVVWCVAPYLYEGKVRDSILRFKFYGCREHAPVYAKGICEELAEQKFLSRMDIVTAVPLSKRRMRTRGYNQSALVAKEAAQLLELPYRDILEKYKENRIQHELDRRNRAKNVRGVYRILPGEEITGKQILLIDDIMTTGATLQECAEVLLRHGAASVLCAVIAVVQ